MSAPFVDVERCWMHRNGALVEGTRYSARCRGCAKPWAYDVPDGWSAPTARQDVEACANACLALGCRTRTYRPLWSGDMKGPFHISAHEWVPVDEWSELGDVAICGARVKFWAVAESPRNRCADCERKRVYR